MPKITNKAACDIQVNTPAGKFVFPVGKEVELDQDRAERVAKHGAVYFTAEELVSDEALVGEDYDETGEEIDDSEEPELDEDGNPIAPRPAPRRRKR